MKPATLVLFLSLLFASCQKEIHSPKYQRWVGDIAHDATLDSDSFQLCNGDEYVKQYFNNSEGLEYKGEKWAIIQTFKKEFKPKSTWKDSGLLRVRFIVNCKGETGRFRTMAMDESYKAKSFHQDLVQEILDITKSLDGWKAKTLRDTPIDYYQYLIFKIQDGNIIEILP